MNDSNMMEAALELAEAGYCVVPAPRSKAQGYLTRWGDLATNDPERVRQLFESNPEYGVGILTGDRGGVVVIDVDVAEGKPGLASLEALEDELGPLGDPTVNTGSGGRHYFFAFEELANVASLDGKLAPGIDIKGCGAGASFVFAPPTRRDKDTHGAPYAWVDGQPPRLDTFPRMPDAWAERIRDTANEERSKAIAPHDRRLRDIGPGTQNDTIYRALLWQRQRGMEEADLRVYADKLANERCTPPHPAHRVESTIRSILDNVQPWPDGDGLDGSVRKQFEPFEGPTPGKDDRVTLHGFKDYRMFGQCLAYMGLGMRLNTRRMRCEFQVTEDGPWVNFTDTASDRLQERMTSCFRRQVVRNGEPMAVALKWGGTYGRAMSSYLHTRQHDPFLSYLESLPAWDGVNRIDAVLPDLWLVDPDDKLAQWTARYLFVGAVQRSMRPGCKLDECAVWYGPQGVGKSALLASVVPDVSLFSDGLRWDMDDKARVEAVMGCVVAELGEAKGSGHSRNLESIKRFISRTDDGSVRLAYAKRPVETPRRFVLIATTNVRAAIPRDPSGSRRFVVVECPGVVTPGVKAGRATQRVEDYIEARRDQLWAEALARFNRGERANASWEMLQLAEEANEEYRAIGEYEDALDDIVQMKAEPGAFVEMTMGEIVACLGLDEVARARDAYKLTGDLRQKGWKSTRRRDNGKRVRLWRSPVRVAEGDELPF